MGVTGVVQCSCSGIFKSNIMDFSRYLKLEQQTRLAMLMIDKGTAFGLNEPSDYTKDLAGEILYSDNTSSKTFYQKAISDFSEEEIIEVIAILTVSGYGTGNN